ncbi:EamA family transporter [Erwinia aphidicola]
MMTFTGWQLLAGGLVVLPAQLLTESLPAALTLTNLLGYAWVAIPGSLCAYWLWFAGAEANPRW